MGGGNARDAVNNGPFVRYCNTIMQRNPWFIFNFGTRKIRPTHYAIRHGFANELFVPRNWRLEASVDGKLWVVLKEHVNDQAITHGFGSPDGHTACWPIVGGRSYFSRFRVTQGAPPDKTILAI